MVSEGYLTQTTLFLISCIYALHGAILFWELVILWYCLTRYRLGAWHVSSPLFPHCVEGRAGLSRTKQCGCSLWRRVLGQVLFAPSPTVIWKQNRSLLLGRLFEKHSELYRKSNCSLPSSSTSNFIENLLDYCQKDWPNCQIPGSWEILTFGFALIWNVPSYFKIAHKREVYTGKNRNRKQWRMVFPK